MIAVYAGSFDPVTNGHLDIIERVAAIMDKLVVGILANPAKTPMFTMEERLLHLQTLTKDYPRVEVKQFRGLQVDFAREVNATAMIRGLRTTMDYENELKMALTNKKLEPELETMFILADPTYAYLSSSVVKDITNLDENAAGRLESMVPPIILKHLLDKKKDKKRGG